MYRRVIGDWPSVRRPAQALTEIGSGFYRLVIDILAPDDDVSAAIRAKVRARAEARRRRDLATPSSAAIEISRMSREQIEELMRSDIPSAAQTRRGRGPARAVA